MNDYPISLRLKEIASLYILNDKVVKCRDKLVEEVTNKDIREAINNKDKVIVEMNGMIDCYFKDEYVPMIKSIISKELDRIKDKITIR